MLKYIESLQDLIGVLNHVTGKVETIRIPILHFIRIIRRYCFKTGSFSFRNKIFLPLPNDTVSLAKIILVSRWL